MSWITGLATRAEAFLEKVDQTAASSLSTDGPKNQSSSMPYMDSGDLLAGRRPSSEEAMMPVRKEKQEDAPYLPRTSSVPNINPRLVNNQNQRANPAKELEEDPLFEFLNNSSIPSVLPKRPLLPKTSTPIRPPSQSVIDGAQQDESKDNFKSNLPAQVKEHNSPDLLADEIKESMVAKATFSIDATEGVKVEENVTAPPEIQLPVPIKDIASERLSNLELENRLLKGELSSLNEELANSVRKVKEYQEELNKAKSDCAHYTDVIRLKEKDLKMLQGNERDYKEAINAKDSQLAVLRVRIQEVDEELKKKTEFLESLQNENERVLKDHSESTGVQTIALDNIKQKLQEAEANYEKEKEARQKTLNELVELRSKLQSEQQEMALTVKQLQSKLNEEKAKVRELDLSAKSSTQAASSAERDLKEYREKATRILQAKEKLIASLRQGTAGVDASPLIVSELEDIKQEKEMIREELQQAKYKLEQFRVDMQELERQHHAENEEQLGENESLQQSLSEEQLRRQQAEEDCQKYQQDLRVLREDVQRQKKYTVEQLQERDKEIRALRNQMAIKSTTSTSQEELENRIRSLTESLIQKQTLVETLSTERSSLSLQLERLEQQYKDVQQSLIKRPQNRHAGSSGFADLEDGEEGNRIRSIESIMPSPISRSRHWKSTVNEIDKFSIRLGLFLRRYPIARLFVILYMFILHLWVTIVLLTYKPEVHSDLPPGAGNAMPHKR